MAKDIRMKVTKKAKEFIAKKGFDQNLGARPLKRVIQKKVLDPLAIKIISGEIKSKNLVTVDLKDGDIYFKSLKRNK